MWRDEAKPQPSQRRDVLCCGMASCLPSCLLTRRLCFPALQLEEALRCLYPHQYRAREAEVAREAARRQEEAAAAGASSSGGAAAGGVQEPSAGMRGGRMRKFAGECALSHRTVVCSFAQERLVSLHALHSSFVALRCGL